MSSKFTQFLKDNKIDPRWLLANSRSIERLRPEDRKAKLARRAAKGEGKPAAPAAEGEEKKEPVKPRSGRPVTPRLLTAASEGKPVAGPAKTRLLRAVNHVLGRKKKDPVDLRALF